MDIKIERAIIRTFKKMQEEGYLGASEKSGIFVNFCYAEYGVHSGLDTRRISILKNQNDVWTIRYNDKGSLYSPNICQVIWDSLIDITDSEFYSMWLRASWENPKEETWGHPVVREALKNYNGVNIETSKEEETNPVDVDTFLKSYSPLFIEEKHELFIPSEMKAKLDEIERIKEYKRLGLIKEEPKLNSVIDTSEFPPYQSNVARQAAEHEAKIYAPPVQNTKVYEDEYRGW